jgi:streptomycin 6-kinase
VAPWWQALPVTIAELSDRWGIEIGGPVGRGNTSLVLRCRRADGRAAILKLTPDAELAAAEASALRAWGPSGRVPGVWGYDDRAGALLLEAIASERPLAEGGSDAELADVAALIGDLHRAGARVQSHGAVPLADRVEFIFDLWITRYQRAAEVTGVVPLERLYRGHELARLLAGDPCSPVLLHGDLHPGNVLDGGERRGLVAIDPRPCVGDAAFDAVDWVFWKADASSWRPRSEQLAAELGLQPARVWAWCSAFAALLAVGRAARGDESGELLVLAP